MIRKTIPSVLQRIYERKEDGSCILRNTIPTPLSVIQSVVVSYRNSDLSDNEFADTIESTLHTIMNTNEVKIIAADPNIGDSSQRTRFEYRKNSSD